MMRTWHAYIVTCNHHQYISVLIDAAVLAGSQTGGTAPHYSLIVLVIRMPSECMILQWVQSHMHSECPAQFLHAATVEVYGYVCSHIHTNQLHLFVQ